MTKSEMATKIAALEARLVIAADVYKAQRATIAGLEAKLATRGHIATSPTAPLRVKRNEPKVTLWTNRLGQLCESTRVGNRTTTHVLSNQEQSA